jgi:hypothetical protein
MVQKVIQKYCKASESWEGIAFHLKKVYSDFEDKS